MTGKPPNAVTLEMGPAGEPSSSNRKLALGAVALAAVNVVKVAIQLLMLPLMARLLGPDEFGIYALALPTVLFVSYFADGGLGATLSREPESSTLVWSSAFWILILMGISLALGASIFGVLLGYVTQQPRVAPMIALLSLSVLFLVLSVSPGARLGRRKNLAVGAAAELVSNLTGAIIAVTLAMKGAGAWSLAAQYLAIYATRALILNAAAFNIPRFEFDLSIIRPHIASGSLLVGARLCDYAGRISENILINRVFGTAFLGSYNFATQISRFTSESVGNVTWTTLYVHSLTGSQVSVVELHRQLCRLLGGILFPATMLAAAAAPQLIDLLLGPKWVELDIQLRVLMPTAALVAIANQVGAVLLANGSFAIQFWFNAGQSLGRVLIILAAPWIGFVNIIYGIGLVALLYSTALLFVSSRSTGCKPLPMLLGLVGPAISSLMAAGACLAALNAFPTSPIATVTCLIFGFVIFGACMFLIDRKGLIEDWEAVRRLMSTREAKQFSID
jgi:O-antigen/teichoic acid export membrane protein